MIGKGNIEHMGDSANSEAEKVQPMSIREVTWSRTAKGQTSANHVEVFSTGVNRVDSKMPHVITARKKVIYARYVRPDCHKCSLKEAQVVKKESKVNSYDSISDDESVGSGNNHARDTPINAAEDVAFGLYRTGTEQLSTESVNRVKPSVVNVQLGRAQINCKMEVDTGASRSTVSYLANLMLLLYQLLKMISN